MNIKQNENINHSITMDLENLQKKYSNLLVVYRAAVSEYILSLNTDSNLPIKVYNYIKDKAYIGGKSIGQSNVNTLQDCIASCSSNPKCSGATFISNRCDIKSGDGQIIQSPNSYAIIPVSKYLLINIENINQQLIQINKQITDKIKIQKPHYYKNNIKIKEQTKELVNNYNNLTQERENILELLRQYETLDSIENQNQIKISQNYYSYILLLLLVIVIFYILYKLSYPNISQNVQYGGELNFNAYYLIFLIIILIIIINLYINYYSI